jgi:hypothetical protein
LRGKRLELGEVEDHAAAKALLAAEVDVRGYRRTSLLIGGGMTDFHIVEALRQALSSAQRDGQLLVPIARLQQLLQTFFLFPLRAHFYTKAGL